MLGRGYILNENKHPVVIGPAHIDIRSITESDEPNMNGNYIAAKAQINYGGPAKNVIDFLFNLGIQPRSILVLGDDEFGRSYIDSCARLGISPSDFIILPNESTSVYSELVDSNRNMISSFHSKLDQMAKITPLDIYAHTDVF